MAKSQKIPGGVWPAMHTCFDAKQRPNPPMLRKLVDLLASQNAGGLYLLGSTGHGPAISVEHRKEIFEVVAKHNRGRLPLMVHVGATATEDAMTLAKHAADHGADAISSVPPIYFPYNADIMFEHYRRIAGATKLPFYAYHAGFAGGNFPPAKEYAKRMLDLPNIGGMKITDYNLYIIETIVAFSDEKLQIFSGADELVCPAAAAGAHGAIGSTYNIFLPAIAKVRQAFLNGDVAFARQFMLAYGKVVYELIASFSGFYGFSRTAMRQLYGIDIGPGRTPFAAMKPTFSDKQVRQMVKQVNDAAGV